MQARTAAGDFGNGWSAVSNCLNERRSTLSGSARVFVLNPQMTGMEPGAVVAVGCAAHHHRNLVGVTPFAGNDLAVHPLPKQALVGRCNKLVK